MRCRYNAVHFHQNPHIRHPIARPLGRGMGRLLRVQPLIYIQPKFLQWCMQYHVILSRITPALDCTYKSKAMACGSALISIQMIYNHIYPITKSCAYRCKIYNKYIITLTLFLTPVIPISITNYLCTYIFSPFRFPFFLSLYNDGLRVNTTIPFFRQFFHGRYFRINYLPPITFTLFSFDIRECNT